MKKLGNVLIAMGLSVSLMPTMVAFASEESYVNRSEEGYSIVVEGTELAVPTADAALMRAGLEWQWALNVDAGLVGGFDVYAMSGATDTVDSLSVKAEMFFKNGSVKKNSNSARNSDICETEFYDASTNNLVRENNSFKSTHTFEHTGYTKTTKTVSRNLSDV